MRKMVPTNNAKPHRCTDSITGNSQEFFSVAGYSFLKYLL